ncbi:MAG: M24 family metallopeptidase [Acidobacteriota bacterium]
MNVELSEKTSRLTAMLGRTGFAGVFLTMQHNFAWLTAGGSNGVDLSRDNGASTLFVTSDGRRFVLANTIEMPRLLAEELSAEDFEPLSFPWQAGGEVMAEKARDVCGSAALLASDIWMPGDVTPIEHEVAPCRFQLTPDEADRYRTLGHDAGTAMLRVISQLEPGETELEIAEKLRHEFALADMTSIVTLVAGDERISKFRHPVPTMNRWNRTLLLVACAKRGGLVASLSRMICVGSVPHELAAKTEAAAYVNACLMEATRPSTTSAQLYAIAAAAYAERGFGGEIDLHHQGGAAGYRSREWVARPNGGETVFPSQAFAWNPSITGTKVEETCIVDEHNVEVITASPDFPAIESMVNGRLFTSPGIFSL